MQPVQVQVQVQVQVRVQVRVRVRVLSAPLRWQSPRQHHRRHCCCPVPSSQLQSCPRCQSPHSAPPVCHLQHRPSVAPLQRRRRGSPPLQSLVLG